MSMWYDDECRQGPGHWIDSAISQAFHGGFHRDAAPSDLSLCDWHIRRRVWWACFARDRLLSLAWGRPAIIRDEDFDVAPLREEDFTFDDSQTFGSRISLGFWQNQRDRHRFVSLYIATVDLCRHLSNTSETYRHSPLSDSTTGPIDYSRMLRLENRCTKQGSDTELLQWYNSLSWGVKPGVSLCDALKENDPLKVQEVNLELLYYAATSFIYRARFTFLSDSAIFDPERERMRMCMRYAAWRISEIAGVIHEAKMANLLPPTSITSALLGAAVHLVDMKGTEMAEYQSHEGFARCLRLIDDMKEVHGAAYVAEGAISWALEGIFPGHHQMPNAAVGEPDILDQDILRDLESHPDELFCMTGLLES